MSPLTDTTLLSEVGPGGNGLVGKSVGGDQAANGRADTALRVILSFDVEEHDRIESARGLFVEPALRQTYAARLAPTTYWILEQLERRGIRATFFILGQIARAQPDLVRAIHRGGHEVASHGWDHKRLHSLTPATLRQELRQSLDALSQITGEAVVGFRAPTFSLMPQTAWAVDVLAEAELLYDSSIYPVRHDRYGMPGAPRGPFRIRGREREVLELPPLTLRVFRANLAVGGGGYFRLYPLAALERALGQVQRDLRPAVAMLYFHPWEFDAEQPRLPLALLSRLRTYVGLRRTRARLESLLGRYRFSRAADVAAELQNCQDALPYHSPVV
jgi:polysaccharide deacetylase family protein (PEP-CTERM system associated)